MKCQNLAKGPWTQNLTPGTNYLIYDCWYPGKSIHTHIVGLCKKIMIFLINLILSQRPLGPKIWQQGPNYLKHDCLGPGESIDTHIVGFCEKIAIFLNWGQRTIGAKIWPQGQNHPKMIAGVQVIPQTYIVWGFVRKLQIFEFGAKGPLEQKFGLRVQITLQ